MENFSEGLNTFSFSISSKTSMYKEQNDTISKSNELLKNHYNKLTKVDIDEEMTKLMQLPLISGVM